MKRSDFTYELPNELIARYPTENRSDSRLLVLSRENGMLSDELFPTLESYLKPGDLLVFNNTKVIPARLFGRKSSGGKLEILVERLLDDQSCLAHVRSSRSPKPGATLEILDGAEQVVATVEMVERQGALFRLHLEGGRLLELLEREGHMPLPPYIDRPDEDTDQCRYQTVYAKEPGAVAAPTAGLHFDEALLARLGRKGVECAFVTLHVGAGTFQPVKADNLHDHVMHSEWLDVPAAVIEQIKQTKQRGGRVIAVGTTSVRCLESAALFSSSNDITDLQPYTGDTDIFIYPGYEFKVIDGLLTNFHLPESTLIMLVSALAGHKPVLNAYNHAVERQYRFFSYGDAMLII